MDLCLVRPKGLHGRWFHRGWTGVIARGLAGHARKRYRTMEELLAALERAGKYQEALNIGEEMLEVARNVDFEAVRGRSCTRLDRNIRT